MVIGSRARVKVVKNKVSPPFRQVEFDIMHTGGISREGSLLDIAANDGIVQKSGTWYSFENERIGQGRENVKKTLVDNPEMSRKIENLVRAKHDLPAQPASATPASRPAPTDSASAAAPAAGEEEPKGGKTVKLTVKTGDG